MVCVDVWSPSILACYKSYACITYGQATNVREKVNHLYGILNKEMPSRLPKRKDAIRTRSALLAAATECFACCGYDNTNMRQVCTKAGVNLGAVKHYFGNKETLYREVLVRTHRDLVDREPVPEMAPDTDPRDALHDWICYLLRIFMLRRTTHPFAGRLIAWELRDPTAALDDLIAEVLGPVRDSLDRIIVRLLGNVDDPERRARCADFVHGICVFYDQNRELLRRFGHPVPACEEEVVALADDITTFAVAGIEQLRDLPDLLS